MAYVRLRKIKRFALYHSLKLVSTMTRAEMNWKIFRSVLPLIALVAFAYYTTSLKTDYSKEEPVVSTDSHELTWRFQMNEGSELLNKVVKVKGKVTGYDSLLLILDHKVICQLHNEQMTRPEIGDSVSLKGRCVTYDDLLEELRLDHVIQIIE